MWLRGGATALIIAFAPAVTLAACGGASPGAAGASPGAGAVVAGAASSAVARAARSSSPAPRPSPRPSASPSPVRLPAAGNPAGQAEVPPAGQPVSTSHPDHVIGDGTPASCTSRAVVAAVAAGGVITFSCGPRGGAIFDLGGQLKVVDSRFIGNRCFSTGPDLGGAAIRALSQWDNRPVYITSDTFRGGACSNGGALSSIGVSWVVLNSVMTRNQAIGVGANPARSGAPGGGSGGAIYTDGDQYTVTIAGTVIAHNQAREGGGAIFFVSNNKTGTLTIEDSTLPDDPSDGFETAGFPGIFYIGQGRPVVTSSTLG